VTRGVAFSSRLRDRAAELRIPISEAAIDQLETYIALLARWNEKTNLTSLKLAPLSDEALDRLLVEPLAAARFVDDWDGHWFDLGSGGGSPAIPLKVVRPKSRLTMVESRSRKVAFLRDAVRILGLQDTGVQQSRFDDLAGRFGGIADVVTIRAVREDQALPPARALLRPGGKLLWFGLSEGRRLLDGFDVVRREQLLNSESSAVSVLRRVFHVEHRPEP
jgi:16S rRNA (guanine527-N7)-methyltransferase